ncbi:MAG: hypothetical protein CR975_04625 [Gammaproteobacteria bacterium]|nr:MAG: hypothetical protein CR975_04625 [Gammaproteobacteria bacterium]
MTRNNNKYRIIKRQGKTLEELQQESDNFSVHVIAMTCLVLGTLWFIALAIFDYSHMNINHAAYADDWIAVPAERLSVTQQFGGRCQRHSSTKTSQCLIADYTYHYQNQTYQGNQVTEVVAAIYDGYDKAALIRKQLLSRNQVYLRPQSPESAVLLPRYKYLQTDPQDSSEQRRKWITWTIPYFFLIWWGISRDNKGKTTPCQSSNGYVFRRIIATYLDVVLYLVIANFLLAIHGNFYYFSKLIPSVWWFDAFLWAGLPMMIVGQWLLFGATLGMQMMNLRLANTHDLSKPTPWQVFKRFGLLLVCLVTLGLPLLFSIGRKDKQSLAKWFSQTMVVCLATNFDEVTLRNSYYNQAKINNRKTPNDSQHLD